MYKVGLLREHMNIAKFKNIWYVLSQLIFSFFRLLNFSLKV